MEIRGSHNFLRRPTFNGSGLALKDSVLNNAVWGQNGFTDRDDSTISFDDTTRKFQIAATGTSFEYYMVGQQHASSGASVTIPNTEGVHFIYFDSDILVSDVNPSNAQIVAIVTSKVLVSVVYWSTMQNAGIFVGEERHGKEMAIDTHIYLHLTEGLRYLSGLGLTNMSVDAAGSTSADAQFAVDAGAVADEDIRVATTAVPLASGLPMYYLVGSGAIVPWRRVEPSGFSVIRAGDTAGDRLAYNQFTGGAWQLTEVSNLRFVLTHIFATTEINKQVIGILGQNEYLNIAQARTGADTEIRELVSNQILLPETHPIATVIFQTSDAYANVVKARARSTLDGDNYVDWRDEAVSRVSISTSDHNSLNGLQGGQAAEYYHLSSAEHAGLTDVTIQTATSGSYSVDWSAAGTTRIILDGNITFTFANPYDGQKHIIQIKQDASGAHTATWPATVRWPAGTAPTLTATSGGIDYIGFAYDGTDGKYDGLANSLDLQ